MEQIIEHIGHKVVLNYQDPEYGNQFLNVRIAECKKREDGDYDVTVHYGGCLFGRINSKHINAIGSSNIATEKLL